MQIGVCLSKSRVCDGEANCPINGDDELSCDKNCPRYCACDGYSILCIQKDSFLTANVHPESLISLKLGKDVEDSNLGFISKYKNMMWLDLSANSISNFPLNQQAAFQRS